MFFQRINIYKIGVTVFFLIILWGSFLVHGNQLMASGQ